MSTNAVGTSTLKFTQGPLVAVIGIVVVAALGTIAFLLFKPANDVASSTNVIAVLGLILSPIVAIVSAYYGISVSAAAAKGANDNQQILLQTQQNMLRNQQTMVENQQALVERLATTAPTPTTRGSSPL
jgi:phosphate/sulfate permease